MKNVGKGKRKPVPFDIPNQKKITSFFTKKTDSGNSDDVPGQVTTATTTRNLSANQKTKIPKVKVKPVISKIKKEIEVILISESSSDSDLCPVPVTVTTTKSESENKNTDELELLQIVNTVRNKEEVELSSRDDDAIESEEINFKQAIRIVGLQQICELETQVCFEDTCQDELDFVPLSPSMLEDVSNPVLETPAAGTFNDFLSRPIGTKVPESFFDSNPDGESGSNCFGVSSPSSFPASEGFNKVKSPLPENETADSSDKKSIGLFLSPQKSMLQLNRSSPKTPTKSPKSIATYFSPVRHLRRPERISPNPNSPRSMATATNRSPNKNTVGGSDPYYYKNFIAIINSVFSDEHHEHLIHDNDRDITNKFHNLSKQSQCLYIRLFQRKWSFKPASSIKYPLISENLNPYFQELHEAKFLEELKDEKRDLEVVLDLLNGEQMSLLSKSMGIAGKTKEVCKSGLLKMSQNQKTLFSSSSEVIYKEAIKLLGSTYRICLDSKNLFSRYFILHSPPQYWEDQSDLSSNQLLSILLMDMGKMEYPVYNINKSTKIYSSRDDLISFQEAWSLFSELNAHIESKNWTEVCRIGDNGLELLQKQLSDRQVSTVNAALPAFLRVYTAGSVLAHTVWLSVQGHQKLKHFSRANDVISTLLAQSVYLGHHRGRWFERSIVNMKHLKKPLEEVMKTVKNALVDTFAQDSHKYMLTLRYEKLVEEYNRKLNKGAKKDKMETDEEEPRGKIHVKTDDVPLYHLRHEIPSRTIEGEKLEMFNGSNSGPSGFKSVFLGSRSASSVEQFAMNYYSSEGYMFGVHGEGSVPVSIFGLLFWDVIYNDEIPDVFQSVFQPFPLDMNFEEFYNQRTELFNKKVDDMRTKWSIEHAQECIKQHWNANINKICIVNWSLFSSLDDVNNLVKSMGLQVTASICERMAKNYRHYRSGFPDLCLWNGSKCIFVEVKGPGDSLSAKQSVWIDFLLSAGARVEVCNVRSVSNKRIRTK